MSAQSTLLTAVRANERGVFEYLPKPFDLNELIAVVERALMQSAPDKLVSTQSQPTDELPLIGRSSAMQEIYRVMARLMLTDLTVLITGESGTGKELVARALHDYGNRKEGPFVAINMAAIPRELIESELLAMNAAPSRARSVDMQVDLSRRMAGPCSLTKSATCPWKRKHAFLRVLQEGEFTAVGGRSALSANARIVAATHRDLRMLVQEGVFREDLYYRLNVVPVRLPPLRERVEDIPELVRHFLRLSNTGGNSRKILDQGAIERLKQYHWPGNIRELENLIRRLTALYAEETVSRDAIDRELPEISQGNGALGIGNNSNGLAGAVAEQLESYFSAHKDGVPPTGLYDRVLHEIERPLITMTLNATKGNQIKAAAVLGLNRNTLRKKIRILDIPVSRKKQRGE